ncbi:bromodomain adjacent to zinc finger domain protein 1A [Drosophila tropicalis]|uniref:bromodomain adjacent to zinc finger domain protein 1A n=1 Tax=Drosophila tropicalis TaxID=46794 RepID=UPI0035ABCA63
MPICKREGFDINDGKNVTFHDNDLVFCCYITMRIFKDYEDYFRHVMVINSTVWQCEATGRDNLTYEEALKSERVARKKMEQFKHSLRAPVLLVIEHARQSAVKTLNLIVGKFLRKRYFFNEEVIVVGHKKNLYEVVGIIPGKEAAQPVDGIYEDTDNLDYRVRVVGGDAKTEITVPFDKIRRQRTDFNVENLGMFIKNNVSRVDGILRPKSESFKQYVSDKGINFNSLFIGKMPHYAPAKSKRPNDAQETANKKQSTLNKYIVKGEEATSKAKAKEAKSLAENMERMRLEKEAWLAEAVRQKAEKKAQLAERVDAEINYLLQKTDDLERKDQRMMPTYKPVVTFLQEKLIGDAFMMREFMHTYCGLLSGIEVFRQNLSFYEMSRALSAREVAGPLSDILLVLLGTVFDLQKEEDEDSVVQYALRNHTSIQEPFLSMSNATRSHYYAKRHFSFKIYDLPLDALTLSEVLRLHLLSSGAFVDDKSERWRIMYRNGYSSREDPGLALRMRHSHILRFLKTYPIYQLGFRDIMRVIRCLMDQILTYSATLNVIDERMEQMTKAKMELRTLLHTENRRLAAVEQNKRRLTTEHHQKCLSDDLKNDTAKKQALGDKLNKTIAELHAQSDVQQRKHEQQVLQMHTQLFNFLVYLGMDRCYRKYYVLESCPGIFIEHPPDSMDVCLHEPPLNKSQAEVRTQSQLPKNRKDLRFYLMKLYGEEDKKPRKSAAKQSLENKENQEHHINGHAEPMELDAENNPSSVESPTQYQLLMCTGDSRNCIVHNERDGQRQRWAYIYMPEEIDELIKSLNPLGWRESQLLEEFSNLRTLIVEHTKSCPADMLSLDTEKKRNSFVSAMYTETNRKYGEANFGLNEGTDLNEVMQLHLVDRILKFESDIYTGDLGQLKVKDMEKWRNNLLTGNYDAQCKLQWGPRGKHDDALETAASAAGSDNESHEDYLDDHDEEIYYGRFGRKPYRDPGIYLGPTLEIDSEDSADDEVPILDSKMMQDQVQNMASALLQVEQAIQRRFLKEPYGPSKRDTKQDMMKVCEARLQQWEVSLMESTSFAQVFLHLNLLHDCIHWRRSTNKSLCRVCRRGTDPEKMLLCDECNAGTHMFCMKPKMRTVPEGNWYCRACDKQKTPAEKKNKRKLVTDEMLSMVENEDEEEQDEEEDEEEDDSEADADVNQSDASSTKLPAQVNGRSTRRVSARRRRLKSKDIEEAMENDDDDASESVASKEEHEDEQEEQTEVEEDAEEEEEEAEDEKVCQVCFYDGSEIRCVRCSLHYHLECAQLKRTPRTDFICKKCKTTETTQRSRRRQSPANDDDDNDEEPDEPQPKRSRSSRSSVRISLDKSGRHSSSNNNNNDTSNKNNNNNNNRRSGRRTNDDLPLNSSALYDLLERTMKHKLAWPFLRPVLSSEVPDYHQIVKTPMDLAKVKSKLNMGEYQLNEELLNDIQLVFHNCDLYNVEGNEIYDAGSQLERFVMERCRDMHLPFKPSKMNPKMVY